MDDITALIVDDDEGARLILSAMLSSLGYPPIVASSADEALEIISENNINLILCDWEMPGISGLELCRSIRESDSGQYTYFILVSGRTEQRSIITGLQTGADDFISKPVDVDELTVRLNSASRVINLEKKLEVRNKKLESAYETITNDLRIAAKIQDELLPRQYKLNRFNTSWMFKPAHYVSGDLFDYFPIYEQYLAFYILDVEGHGIPSALTTFSVNNQLNPSSRGICARYIRSCESIDDACVATVTELNRQFARNLQGGRYFTMIYGIIDIDSGRVAMTQAGHPPAIQISGSTGEVAMVGNGGLPVGLLEEATYQSVSCDLSVGDRLFVYSDGTLECANSDDEFYGNERLATGIKKWSDKPIKEVSTNFDKELTQWNGSDQFDDDVSMVVFEYTEH